MNQSKKKLVRQLEQLQQQVEKLRQTYLAQDKSKIEVTSPKKITREFVTTAPDDDKLQEKDQKLLELIIRTGKENDLYKAVSKKLKTLIKSGKTSFALSDLQEIQQAMEQIRGKADNWEIFKQKFSAVHKDFFDKLKAAHPDLTKTEQKFCAFIRIRMNSVQIASVLNISKEAIRKKFGLETSDSLEEYINRF